MAERITLVSKQGVRVTVVPGQEKKFLDRGFVKPEAPKATSPRRKRSTKTD